MKNIFSLFLGMALSAGVTISAKAEHRENICNVSVEYKPRFLIPLDRAVSDRYMDQFKQLQTVTDQELQKRNYVFDSEAHLNFYLKFHIDIEDSQQESYVLTASLFVRHKELERLLIDPLTSPYIDRENVYRQINISRTINRDLFWKRGASLADLGKTLLSNLPPCSELKADSHVYLTGILTEAYKDLEKNKKYENHEFMARLPERDSPTKSQYCISEFSPISCQNEEGGPRSLRLGTCSAEVRFRINGDPRSFHHALYGSGYAKDDLNAPLASLIWNIPLLGTPELVGKWITNAVAEGKAEKDLKEFIRSYPQCGK